MGGNIHEVNISGGSETGEGQVLEELNSIIGDLVLYLETHSDALKELLADARSLVAEVPSIHTNNVRRIASRFEELITRYDNLTEAPDRDQRQPIVLPVSLNESQIRGIKVSIEKELNERIRYLAFIFEQKTSELERCLRDARSLKAKIEENGIKDSYERKARGLNAKIDRIFRPLEESDKD